MAAAQAQIPEQISTLKNEPERDLLSWTAPSRPFKRRDREFYVTLIAIAAVVALVMFFTEGFMPVILIVSIVFLVYVMSTVEPEQVQHKITNKGIYTAGRRTDWEQMVRFWFTKRLNSMIFVMQTLAFPGRLEVVIDPAKKEEIKKTVEKYIPEEEVPPSSLDRAANWFAKRLPGLK